MALLLVLAGKVDADEFPSRAIRILVPFAAGGPSDTSGRIASSLLSGHIGQNVYVENRTGGGAIALLSALPQSADPDRTGLNATLSATGTEVAAPGPLQPPPSDFGRVR